PGLSNDCLAPLPSADLVLPFYTCRHGSRVARSRTQAGRAFLGAKGGDRLVAGFARGSEVFFPWRLLRSPRNTARDIRFGESELCRLAALRHSGGVDRRDLAPAQVV